MTGEEFYRWLNMLSIIDRPVTKISGQLKNQQSATKPLIMGILNITPDSFFDGGRYCSPDIAYQRALKMIDQGADIIDIGGESSRPGASIVPLDEELKRVLPIIHRIRAVSDICLSIDTYKAEVMNAAVLAGVNFINDITALSDQNSLQVAAKLNVPVCLMHMQGYPASMQKNPNYPTNVVNEVNDFFAQRIEACLQAGIVREHLILDPGLGFGKTTQHNLQLLNQLNIFTEYKLPIMLGISRKGFIGNLLNKPVNDRLIGSIATAVYAVKCGVKIIRTHDVDETRQALCMLDAIMHVDRDI